MPKASGHRPVFQLYNQKLRLQDFPRADWRFLIHAATNTARAFSIVHASGFVIGDVNHGNLFIAQDGTVKLIDCDSFQVSQGGRTWLCEVGIGIFQPPEMQGIPSYKAIRRSPNYDNFGLAVLVFHLLCIGRHPFAGTSSGLGEAPTIEEAIAGGHYAYATEAKRTRLSPPPGSLPINVLPPTIRALFEEAFAPAAVRNGRPSADRWAQALQDLSRGLRKCSAQPGHHYPADASGCPWCSMEAATGRPLFPAVFVLDPTSGSGMVVLWQEVSRLVPPVPLGPLPDPYALRPTPSPAVVALRQQYVRGRLTVVAAYATAVLAILVCHSGRRPTADAGGLDNGCLCPALHAQEAGGTGGAPNMDKGT